MLGGLGYTSDLTRNSLQALELLKTASFDTVLLDLRYSEMPAGEWVPAIKELRPNLVGRVLVINGEVSDPGIIAMISKNCWTYVPPHRVMQKLRERLRSLLGLSQPASRSAA